MALHNKAVPDRLAATTTVYTVLAEYALQTNSFVERAEGAHVAVEFKDKVNRPGEASLFVRDAAHRMTSLLIYIPPRQQQIETLGVRTT